MVGFLVVMGMLFRPVAWDALQQNDQGRFCIYPT
jgi:hypothetical protein